MGGVVCVVNLTSFLYNQASNGRLYPTRSTPPLPDNDETSSTVAILKNKVLRQRIKEACSSINFPPFDEIFIVSNPQWNKLNDVYILGSPILAPPSSNSTTISRQALFLSSDLIFQLGYHDKDAFTACVLSELVHWQKSHYGKVLMFDLAWQLVVLGLVGMILIPSASGAGGAQMGKVSMFSQLGFNHSPVVVDAGKTGTYPTIVPLLILTRLVRQHCSKLLLFTKRLICNHFIYVSDYAVCQIKNPKTIQQAETLDQQQIQTMASPLKRYQLWKINQGSIKLINSDWVFDLYNDQGSLSNAQLNSSGSSGGLDGQLERDELMRRLCFVDSFVQKEKEKMKMKMKKIVNSDSTVGSVNLKNDLPALDLNKKNDDFVINRSSLLTDEVSKKIGVVTC
ncbi:unnamed protein product [Ambrosiozyma monospora]|uniref:Unnamed protein product n=1 Tax=Ambrosiozyma monospora TaxID=43982 RepID=A0A9W6YY92_AMBMO|nr:unnamed protein product [Ambrosiozyma monospora]